MKHNVPKRLLSVLLVLAMLLSMLPGRAFAAGSSMELAFEAVESGLSIDRITESVPVEELEEEPLYADTDMVRVSIVLEQASTVDAGYSTHGIASNAQAMAYRESLRSTQAVLTRTIEATLGSKLDVQWNLTLAANIISANVQYGQIDTIAKLRGVKAVEIEPLFTPDVVEDYDAEPQMISSTPMTGSDLVWAAGYTGLGSRIAVIDTGIDTDHQSFSNAAFQYGLAHKAGLQGVSIEEYMDSLDLLDAQEVEGLKDKLNVSIDPAQTYVSSKIPYAYNYIDKDYDVTHDNDTQGSHGSHVTGIAAANAYIRAEDGSYVSALEAVDVQGVAPDAQVLTMKVFGKGGGAYSSDYMAAIEDAIILGCDSVNLSLGSANPGFSYSTFEDVMDSLIESDTVVVMSAGNSGAWNSNSQTGVNYLYADDISMDTVGSPGAYTNSMAVASADNTGKHGEYIKVGETLIFYSQSSYTNAPIKSIAGEHEYVIIDGIGTPEQWDAVGDRLQGRVAVCSRGQTSFFEKANAAVEHGAAAVIIYNNQPGTINMNLEGYLYTNPCISITQADGEIMKAAAEAVTDDSGNVICRLGSVTIGADAGFIDMSSEYVTMSSFSSMGVPGSLILKPEITAPGGNIYSVNGVDPSGKAYENNSGTSMAAPQVAGMAALVAQYIRENDLETVTGLGKRQLTNSLLMSTAVPQIEEESGYYWSVLKQGSGLANVNDAVCAGSYILMDEDATASWADGKVKAELGDDPDRTGAYSFGFTIHNFSGGDKEYTLNADIFTQDTFTYGEYAYLDTWTTPIAADVVFTVNGEVFTPVSIIDCDLDGDGDTDADDAQIIMDYSVGSLEQIDEIADVSGDGAVSTYDAHLILENLKTRAFPVALGESAEVRVDVTFSDEVKAWLDETYVNGAYIEGYVFAEPVASGDGGIGVTHSIPVMGFYGGWTDASMFDKATYWDYEYGAEIPNYTALRETHVLYEGRKGSAYAVLKEPNPYMHEETFPTGRVAISRTSTVAIWQWNMIRAAAAVALVDLDESGKVRNLITYGNQFSGAFYYSSAGSWQSTKSMWALFQKIGGLDIHEGDVLNWTMVAIPEYYLPKAEATPEEIIAVIDSGVLGEGAYKSIPMTVDDTPPQVLRVSKDLFTGDLIVKAQDANYIATMQVMSVDGGKVYATALPEAVEAGQITETVLDIDPAVMGEKCIIALGDYAGNETFVEVEYGGKADEGLMKLYMFTPDVTRVNAGWISVDPASVYYNDTTDHGGMTAEADKQMDLYAGTNIGEYVFVAASDGKFYVTRHGAWDTYEEVGTWKGVSASVYDMAYNPVDGLIYTVDALGSGQGKLYALNPYTGEYALRATITMTNPRGGPPMYKAPKALAIDDEGTFYTVNWGGTNNTFLYKFAYEEIADGTVGTLSPVNSGAALNIATNMRPTMAWNEADGMLYLAGGNGGGYVTNKLSVIDPATGTVTLSNTDTETYGSGAGVLYIQTVGMYILPERPQSIQTADTAVSISLSSEAFQLYTKAEYALSASVAPWNLADKTVIWTSSDENVAVVDENGVVTGVSAGSAVITATTVAEPGLSAACEVTVRDIPSIDFSAQVTKTDGTSIWADFNTSDINAYTYAADTGFYMGGALMEDQLYVQYRNSFVSIDADSFQQSNDFGFLHTNWSWSDAAPSPRTDSGCFGGLAGLCYSGAYFIIITPETGSVDYWNLADYFLTDGMALLAFREYGIYVDNGRECEANYYYVMTDSGALWELVHYTGDQGTTYKTALTFVCDTGIDLFNVSQFAGAYGSMIYDAESGCLVVSSSTEHHTTRMYLVDPTTSITLELGELGENVDSVTVLYQYARATELEVRLNKTEAFIYQGDRTRLSAKVRPAVYTGGVTWSSSDESVATVDADGVVRGVSEGTAVITAVSEDVNEAGEHASAACTVTVAPLVPVDAQVSAQVVTDDGTYWADIDLNTMETTLVAEAGHAYTGAGYAGGMLWGTAGDHADGGFVYQIDPANDYQETIGRYSFLGRNMFRDLTGAPVGTYTWGGEEHEAFGYPVTISASSFMIHATLLEGYGSGILTSLNFPDAAALTFYDYYYSPGKLSDGTEYNCLVARYLVLDVKGTLYQVDMIPIPVDSRDAAYYNSTYTGSNMRVSVVGSVGMQFSAANNMGMACIRSEEKGQNMLVISDSSSGNTSLYTVDMNAETLSCYKIGSVGGVSDLAGLYTDFDTIAKMEDVPHATGIAAATAAQSQSDSWKSEGMVNTGNCSMHSGLRGADTVQMTGGRFLTGAATGSTNAAAAEAVIVRPETEAGGAYAENGEVVLTLSETEDTTNGILEITYDPAALTYAGVTSSAECTAVRVDEHSGIVTFAYASAEAVSAGSELAKVTFTYSGCADTELAMKSIQRNDVHAVSEEPAVVAVLTEDGHDYQITERVEPDCFHDGYEVLTCAVCRHSITNILSAGSAVCPSAAFADLELESWYHEGVDYVLREGIMVGMDENHFGPGLTVNRGQMVTILYRMAGEPEVTGENPFTDVDAAAFYGNAAVWAYEQGITTGTTETTFSPNRACSRAEMVTFLWRAMGKPESEGENPFADVSETDFFCDAVLWAVENGITTGVAETVFAPYSDCSRAEAAVFVFRTASK